MARAKTNDLKMPLKISPASTTWRRSWKKASKLTAIWWLMAETSAPPSQPTGMANITNAGRARAMASMRGSTR